MVQRGKKSRQGFLLGCFIPNAEKYMYFLPERLLYKNTTSLVSHTIAIQFVTPAGIRRDTCVCGELLQLARHMLYFERFRGLLRAQKFPWRGGSNYECCWVSDGGTRGWLICRQDTQISRESSGVHAAHNICESVYWN